MSNIHTFACDISMLDMLEQVVIQAGYSNLVDIRSESGNGYMRFTEGVNLSEQDQSALDGIVASFDDDYYSKCVNSKIVNLVSNSVQIGGEYWNLAAQWLFQGRSVNTINTMYISSYLLSGGENEHYHLRLYDQTNAAQLWTASYSNITSEHFEIDLTQVTMPSIEAVLEMHIKTDSVSGIVNLTNISAS